MMPRRSTPFSGSRPWRAPVFPRAPSSSARRACATICSPASVRNTPRLPRSKSLTPSSSSRFFTEAERLGWLTKQRSAAWPKWRASATATMYLSSVRVIGSDYYKHSDKVLAQRGDLTHHGTHTSFSPIRGSHDQQSRRQESPPGHVPHPGRQRLEERDDRRYFQGQDRGGLLPARRVHADLLFDPPAALQRARARVLRQRRGCH